MLNKYMQISDYFRDRIYFSASDLAQVLKIKPQSAKMLASRYAQKGLLIRLKKDFYILKERWLNLTTIEFFQIANLLQVPSYISLMTALNYYEITTQMPRDYIESIAVKRTLKRNINNKNFTYYKLKKTYFSGFTRQGNFFIAQKEKAFIDAVYLYSFGKYRIDLASLDLSKLDLNRIKKMMKNYPTKTKNIIRTICKI